VNSEAVRVIRACLLAKAGFNATNKINLVASSYKKSSKMSRLIP
jgi:hypothetical protein